MRKKSIGDAINKQYKDVHQKPNHLFIPSSSTLLDLACSNKSDGGFKAGSIVNVIGDSSSGKSLLCLSLMASLCELSEFDNYKLIHDDAEYRSNWNIEEIFGKKLYDRLESPGGFDEDGFPINSDKIEDTEYYIHKLIRNNHPFVYVIDSFDSLLSKQDEDRLEERLDAAEKGKKVSGTYDMEFQKFISRAFLKNIRKHVAKTKSLLIVVSQTRTNINPAFGQPKNRRSGGDALTFYCNYVVWLALMGKIKSNKYDLKIGNHVRAIITKNSITSKERDVNFDIYGAHGLDNTGSCIDFLVENEFWKKEKNTIIANGLNLKGTREKLINMIEDKSLEFPLKKVTGRCWKEREEKVKLQRKKRFE